MRTIVYPIRVYIAVFLSEFITTVALQMVTQSSETGQPAEGSAGGRDPGNRDPGGRDRGRDRDNDRLTTGEAGSTGSPGKGSVRHPPKRPPHPTPAPGNQNMGNHHHPVLSISEKYQLTVSLYLLIEMWIYSELLVSSLHPKLSSICTYVAFKSRQTNV